MWVQLTALLAIWLEGHRCATLGTYCLCALAGLVGGSILALVSNPYLTLPYREGHKLKLGFVGTLLGGVLWGLVADHSVPVAMLAGMLGPTVLMFTLNHALPAILRAVVKEAEEEIGKHGND